MTRRFLRRLVRGVVRWVVKDERQGRFRLADTLSDADLADNLRVVAACEPFWAAPLLAAADRIEDHMLVYGDSGASAPKGVIFAKRLP